jgi:elongation factor P
MNTQTYEQYELSKQQMGDNIYYIKDGMELEMLFYNGKANSVRLPLSVQLKVIETPPGFKGDTATGGNKPATLETGLTVQVPLFVNSGDIIKVDTRTGDYQERVA